jgi:hypothetical protein
MKFLIYHSDYYYPYEKVYDTYTEAKDNFEKLRLKRKEEMEFDTDPFFTKDYLCIIVDEISKDVAGEIKL